MNRAEIIAEAAHQGVRSYLCGKVTREDVRLVVPLGVAYGLVNFGAAQFARLLGGALTVATHGPIPLTADRVVANAIIGIVTYSFIAFLQVDHEGLPRGLTLRAAFTPAFVMATVLIGNSGSYAQRAGSWTAAAIQVGLVCVNTLAASLLLRHLRLRRTARRNR